MPDTPLMPTGGIAAADAPRWLASGALAVGVGVGGDLYESQDIATTPARARQADTA